MDYTNLCYCCNRCNSRKSCTVVPAVLYNVPLDQHIEFRTDGTVIGRTREGSFLIDLLQLNAPSAIGWRLLWLQLHGEAQAEFNGGRFGLKSRLFGYPDDLPELARSTRVPHNTRPEGVAASAHALRDAGKLPQFYG
jgi:hypothetical protein